MKPSPVPFDALMLVVGMLVGAFYGRRLYARGVRLSAKTNARQAGLLATVCVSFIGISFGFMLLMYFPRAFWYLPLVVDYYCVPGAWAVIVSMVGLTFGAVGALLYSQRHRALWVVAPACVLVFGGGEWIIQNSVWFTVPEISGSRIDDDGIVRQTSATTCGAAACANVARAYGIEKTEREMVELLGTTDSGTTTAQMIYGMRRLGFDCRKRKINDGDFTRLNAPALLFVMAGGTPLDHAVAYMGHKDGKAEIWNPRSGKEMLTREQLAQIWLGHAVEVRKTVE